MMQVYVFIVFFMSSHVCAKRAGIIADSVCRIVRYLRTLGKPLEAENQWKAPPKRHQWKAPPKRGLFCPLRARPQINQRHSAAKERHTQVTALAIPLQYHRPHQRTFA